MGSAEAARWYRAQLRYMLDSLRAGGWMADFGEYTPLDAVSAASHARGTLRANALHNRFPALWARVNAAAVREHCNAAGCGNASRPVYFMRAGSPRSPQHTSLQWMGDQLVTFDRFDGLASAAMGQITAGLAGFASSHSDVGGYTMLDKAGGVVRYVRGEELLSRWLEHSAFADVMLRTHLGNLVEESMQVYSSPAMLRTFSRWSRVHAALFHHRRAVLAGEQQRHGTPWVRHPWLHFPCDAVAAALMPWAGQSVEHSWTGTQGDGRFNLSDLPPPVVNGSDASPLPAPGHSEQVQFMAGPALMVAPVSAHAAPSVSLYLPRGRWLHAWSGAVVDAARACVEDPNGGCADGQSRAPGPVAAVRPATAPVASAVLAPACGGRQAASGAWVRVRTPIGSPAVFCLLAPAADAAHEAVLPRSPGEGERLCATVAAAAVGGEEAAQRK